MKTYLVLSETHGESDWGKKWHIVKARGPVEAAEAAGADADSWVRVLELKEPLTVVEGSVRFEVHHEESP